MFLPLIFSPQDSKSGQHSAQFGRSECKALFAFSKIWKVSMSSSYATFRFVMYFYTIIPFLYFQEHHEYSLAQLDEIMMLLHGIKADSNNAFLEGSSTGMTQHIVLHYFLEYVAESFYFHHCKYHCWSATKTKCRNIL